MKSGICLLLLVLLFACNRQQAPAVPFWVQEGFSLDSPQPDSLPASFKSGLVLLSRRDEPGLLYLLNYRGEVVWYHQVKGTGFKTAHFTDRQTILCILGNRDYKTSYGDEVMELSLQGDTLLRLKKGQADFVSNAHHEVLLAPGDRIALLSSVAKVYDLSARGGGRADTVQSDGILVLDRKGRKVWEWTVFDALDPVADPDIIRSRDDWMHANSLSFDLDGNYLISFYNNGQVWKLDAQTGRVIWKFGRNGDFVLPDSAMFDMGHAVHRNGEGDLMLFDNGVSHERSQTMAFQLDESAKTARLTLRTPIPAHLFNDRMGSAYLAGANHVLQCCSRKNTVLLTDRLGKPCWQLRCAFIPYRAELIPAEVLPEYLTR